MENDKYDILHQRIDTINRQLDAIMDTIQQMAKVIQLLQPVTTDKLKPITEADLNQDDDEFIDEQRRAQPYIDDEAGIFEPDISKLSAL